MKDYIQVSESVFRKAELRIAENKRRSTIVKRNVIAASGAAAVLIAGVWQNDDIRNAITSLPELASRGWSHESNASSTSTSTATTLTSATSETTTSTTSETSTKTETAKTTTEQTSTETTTETTTTAPATSTQPTTTMSKLSQYPHMNISNGGVNVSSATDTMLVLENSMRINVAEGENDLSGVFHEGDEVQFDADFAYDGGEDIYYYNKGSFHLHDVHIYSSENQPNEEEVTEPVTEEESVFNEEDYPINELGEKLDYVPWLVYTPDDPAIEYSFIKENKNFKFIDMQSYKIHAADVKVKSYDNYMLVTDDEQEWYLNRGSVFGTTLEELEALEEGDTLEFVGYFIARENISSLSGMEVRIEKIIKKTETIEQP